MQQVYRFIASAKTLRLEVWPSVRAEMKIAASLAWLTIRDLASPILRTVETGDSSTSGYALMAYPLESVIWKSMRVHEKWRFISMPEELKQLAKKQDVDTFTNLLRLVILAVP